MGCRPAPGRRSKHMDDPPYPQVSMNTFKQLYLSANLPLNIHTDARFGVNLRDLSLEIIPAAVQVLV